MHTYDATRQLKHMTMQNEHILHKVWLVRLIEEK